MAIKKEEASTVLDRIPDYVQAAWEDELREHRELVNSQPFDAGFKSLVLSRAKPETECETFLAARAMQEALVEGSRITEKYIRYISGGSHTLSHVACTASVASLDYDELEELDEIEAVLDEAEQDYITLLAESAGKCKQIGEQSLLDADSELMVLRIIDSIYHLHAMRAAISVAKKDDIDHATDVVDVIRRARDSFIIEQTDMI